MISDQNRRDIAKKFREYDVTEFKESAIVPFLECLGHDYMDWRGILNELADLIEQEPEHTCKNLATRKDDFYCSECGCEVVGCMVDDFGSFDNPLCFSYCPNCRAKVVI